MTASPFIQAGPAPLVVSYLPCLSFSFFFFQHISDLKGKTLWLIRDLPVEFHCNKGSYSFLQDGEKAALAAAIALLRGVSKMKRRDFLARPLPQTPKLCTQRNAASRPGFFHHILHSRSQVYAGQRERGLNPPSQHFNLKSCYRYMFGYSSFSGSPTKNVEVKTCRRSSASGKLQISLQLDVKLRNVSQIFAHSQKNKLQF